MMAPLDPTLTTAVSLVRCGCVCVGLDVVCDRVATDGGESQAAGSLEPHDRRGGVFRAGHPTGLHYEHTGPSPGR